MGRPWAPRGLAAGTLVVDGAVAAALGAVVAASSLARPTAPVVLLLLAASALAWRRAHPTGSAVVVTAVVLAAWWSVLGAGDDRQVGWVLVTGGSLLALTVVSVADHAPRWLAWSALPVSMALAVLAGAALSGLALTPVLLAAVTVALSAWTWGQWRHSQRGFAAALLERAQHAEHERDQRAQLLLAQERADLARELHDVVAHSLVVMTAQADGARFVQETSPRATAEALSTIADTGRSAMRDMQGLLDVLTGGGAGPRAVLVPQPQVADLTALVEAVRSGGLPVRLHVGGQARELSPGGQLAVFRLVQEALTNALRHAGAGATADVTLAWSDDAVDVCVRDDGPGTAAQGHGSGRGLAGMRHRVERLGGSVSAGPRPDGGFEVRAHVPVPTAAPTW